MNIEGVPNVNQFPTSPQETTKRKWLVRERSFTDKGVEYFPENYRKDLLLIDLNSVEEVIGYFLNQEFSDVYVFGCYLEETPDLQELVNLQRNIIKMGARARRIHFCRDEPIPMAWEKVFARLSVIPIVEGLKQISD